MVRLKHMNGSSLLESLLAVLIFSLGVLALLGMQAKSISYVSESKYRTNASFLASQLLSQMWGDLPANCPSYAYTGSGPMPPVLSAWNLQVQDMMGSVVRPPTITVTPSTLSFGTQYTVTITIRYQPPNATSVHSFTSSAVIS